MSAKTHINNLNIYTNQIIGSEEFKGLYIDEKVLLSFKTIVNNIDKRAFATFLAKEKRLAKIKEGDYVIFRALKGNNKFEFISKIGRWGKFHIFKEVIEVLSIGNHEMIEFEIIQTESPREEIINNYIDLSGLQKEATLLFREKDMVTIIQGSKTPITLPLFIEVTPTLIELCFLIHGDGHYQDKLFFVNKDASLHKFVLDKFNEIFKIPKELWRARVLFNNIDDKEKAKKWWKNALNLKDEQFYPTISKSKLNTSPIGNLRIVIDKTIVSLIFRYVFNKMQDLDEVNSLHALNGLLNAEGSVDTPKDRGLHRITISFGQKEKEIFERILTQAQLSNLIETKRDRFLIDNWDNLYEFFKIFLSKDIIPFDIHQERCKKALSGFLEHSFTKTMVKYLTILNKKEIMNTNEFILETKYLGNSVRKILRKKQYRKFINSSGKGINRSPIVFSITPEGKEFLILIKKIKEVYYQKFEMKEEKSIGELLNFGIINIDKPSGPTSFQVSQFVKNKLGLNKTSHLGTLE